MAELEIDADDISNLYVEDGTGVDNLAIVLCSYFSGHEDRPEDDEENDDNYHWGDWVIAKQKRAAEMLAEQINELLQQKAAKTKEQRDG